MFINLEEFDELHPLYNIIRHINIIFACIIDPIFLIIMLEIIKELPK